jgi:hypothetical protein
MTANEITAATLTQLRDELPTFGGAEPTDTSGIWSWDADQLLVGDGGGEFEIVNRAEWNR